MPWRPGGGALDPRPLPFCPGCAPPSRRIHSPRISNGRIDLTEAEGWRSARGGDRSLRRAALLPPRRVRRLVEGWRERISSCPRALKPRSITSMMSIDEAMLARALESRRSPRNGSIARASRRSCSRRIRVVAGPPNVGKSSLINAFSRSERAIVTDIAGTTRDVIEIPLAIAGVPFVLVDTAGLRDSEDPIERIGVERAGSQAERSDILLWLGDPDDAPQHRQLLLIHPRADVSGREAPPKGALATSATTGEGLDRLTQALLDLAETILPGEGQLALNHRQATEIAAAFEALAESDSTDIVILADSLRRSREALDRITGRSGIDDMLDALFGRFCPGNDFHVKHLQFWACLGYGETCLTLWSLVADMRAPKRRLRRRVVALASG